MSTQWIQWRLHIKTEVLDMLEPLLLDLGAVSITYQDAADRPVFEPDPGEVRLWSDLLLVALFDAGDDIKTIEQQIQSLPLWHKILAHDWEVLEDRDWIRAWMDDYHAMRFGKDLWICPTGETPVRPDAINLFLDPGLAFGTGTHPTTALCLEFLEGKRPKGQTLIDFGCGSGILALAAVKLGADKVVAVDHDPQAVIATSSNAEQNNLTAQQIQVFQSEDFEPFSADGVLANILAATLKELVAEIVTLVKPGGWIALSGILESQSSSVLECYRPWFDMAAPVCKDEWVLLTGTKKA